jgi:hypothetical protein
MAAAALLAVAGCLAPTLPVPPPAVPDIVGPDAEGNVTLKGGPGSARANAEVTVWNPLLDEGRGEGRTTIALPDGSWSETIPAERKGVLYVWQTIGFERSERLELRVP